MVLAARKENIEQLQMLLATFSRQIEAHSGLRIRERCGLEQCALKQSGLDGGELNSDLDIPVLISGGLNAVMQLNPIEA